MASSSGQTSDSHVGHLGLNPLLPPTFADVAETVFLHLIQTSRDLDDAHFAEVCQTLAATDVAGCYGPPGLARDALLNKIWESVAHEAGSRLGATTSEALPSLYDALLQSGGNAPFRLLKKYLTVAGLYFNGSDPHKVLLAAIPKLVPPSLISFARKARRESGWRRLKVQRRLEANGLAMPPRTLHPEALAVDFYLTGLYEGPGGSRARFTFKELSKFDNLSNFIAECTFLRRHTDLEWYVKKAIAIGPDVLPAWPIDDSIPASEVTRIKNVNISSAGTRKWMEMFPAARLDALAAVVEQYGVEGTRRLPGLPPELAEQLPLAGEIVQNWQLLRRPDNDPEKLDHMDRVAAVREAKEKAMDEIMEMLKREALAKDIGRLSLAQMQDEALVASIAARYDLPPDDGAAYR